MLFPSPCFNLVCFGFCPCLTGSCFSFAPEAAAAAAVAATAAVPTLPTVLNAETTFDTKVTVVAEAALNTTVGLYPIFKPSSNPWDLHREHDKLCDQPSMVMHGGMWKHPVFTAFFQGWADEIFFAHYCIKNVLSRAKFVFIHFSNIKEITNTSRRGEIIKQEILKTNQWRYWSN
jgi:hypothetical protein